MVDVGQHRRLPVGAELLPAGGVHIRVWAPDHRRVEVVLEAGPGTGQSVRLDAEPDGHFSGTLPQAAVGTRYRYRLDDDAKLYPDPVSRFQPEGPHGLSEIIDPSAFHWTDQDWRGVKLAGQVIYEMHVGTCTREGTWAAAARELPELARCGITCLEMMPVAEFAGRFGWGYDGVDLFAPTRLYGQPDDLRQFVNEAHANGLAVILDVVYNHLGPDGDYLKAFSNAYFTNRYKNEWGEAINFDGPDAGPVREFFIGNAGYWIDEYHIDGLRLDATQAILDASPTHVLTEIGQRIREKASGRATIVVAENEPQQTKLVRPAERGGYGLDALWNDDFHHSAMVALTGHNEAYYGDYHGTPSELIAAIKYGYLYQGQRSTWEKKRRGSPGFDLPPAAFVTFTQNHDQIANSARGRRAHQLTSPGRYRAIAALMLLGPGTPMLFQGQEFGASSPFLFFADHNPELGALVRKGRLESLSQFPTIESLVQAGHVDGGTLPDPGAPETFERCKLDLSERERHANIYALHTDLLRLRRETPAFAAQRRGGVDGTVLGPEAFALRFLGTTGDDENAAEDRLLLVNLGRDLHLEIAPSPLLAPPDGMAWEIAFSTEDARYDGCGTGPVETDDGWRLPGQSAIVMHPVPDVPRTA
jgi:maltooligosyltrehalose trehalohydrolase